MCNLDIQQERLTFLYNSISDIRDTIRAVDNKLNFMMVILVIPFAKLDAIYNHISTLVAKGDNNYYWFLVGLFALFWVLAFITTLRGLSSISNPAKHVKGNGNPAGTFYAPYFENASIEDALCNAEYSTTSKNTAEVIAALPTDVTSIQEELVYEQLKLSYIRAVKMARQKYAYSFLLLWMGFGVLVWALSIWSTHTL